MTPCSSKASRRIFNTAMVLIFASCLMAGGAPTGRAPESKPLHGIDLAGMGRSIVAGNDFFAFANGSWLKNTAIPEDMGGYGVGTQVYELTSKRTADLIREVAAQKSPSGSEERKIGDFFSAYMDTDAIDARGLEPLRPDLDRIAGISDLSALSKFLGSQLRADVDILNATNLYTDRLFGLWIAQDLNNPKRYLPYLLQGGLGMPDRDYYLDPSPRMADIRAAYAAHIAAVLKLAGIVDAQAKADAIFGLERAIAEAHWSRTDTGDIQKGNNHWARSDFAARAPGLDWDAYFSACGLAGQDEFVVWQPGALAGISALAAAQPLAIWKDYLAFRAIERMAAVLPEEFDAESFSFYGTVLSGVPQRRERWKRAVDATGGALGDAVGKLYVGRYFPAAEKTRLQAMVANIIAAFRVRIDKLEWMTPETKAKAKAKLDVLIVGVGYPDAWTDFGRLEILPGDAFGNAERVELFDLQRSLQKLARPVDRSEWVMTPQTVNAVNLPAMNALNFPAAILQPPFFDPRRPEVMDYGAIGSVIGHEISHSFDDQGALFDAEGKLNNWWTGADTAHFQASAARLVSQYDAYRPFPDAAVKGKQTLGENIADIAGLAVAYDAYRLSLRGRPARRVQGLSGDQQFFLSFAQTWRQKSREASLRRQLITDGHSPAEYRADCVRNLDAWYKAFVVKPGQALYLAPPDRVQVW
jgi:putative endopeptidase